MRPYLICDWLSSEDDPRNNVLIGQILYPMDFLFGPPCRFPYPITCCLFLYLPLLIIDFFFFCGFCGFCYFFFFWVAKVSVLSFFAYFFFYHFLYREYIVTLTND